MAKIPNRGGGGKKFTKFPSFTWEIFQNRGGVKNFHKVPKFIKRGGQKGLKTLIRPYIFRKNFTKFPSLEKGGGGKRPHIVPKFPKFPTSTGGGVSGGWEFFPSFPMFEF